ncbi:MAG: YggS family pyridoxal phosphate-dependent enzyme [Planctomycetaceae bacterium]|nr:YggS family pyridoxal phosphate-dependent enzyme [Planctomycetaceae bacterium]
MTDLLSTIRDNLKAVQEQISAAAGRAGRSTDDIRLVAVTKYAQWPWVEALQQLHTVFGENRPQQLAERRQLLPDVRWHLIGQLQRNKARLAVQNAALIHSVDSARLLQRISDVAADEGVTSPVLLQVNVSGEESKSGFSRSELVEVFAQLKDTRGVAIRGFMTMAPATTDESIIRGCFSGLRELRDRLQQEHGVELPELSMGMSGDFPIAVEEGATLIRVGSRLYEGLPRE